MEYLYALIHGWLLARKLIYTVREGYTCMFARANMHCTMPCGKRPHQTIQLNAGALIGPTTKKVKRKGAGPIDTPLLLDIHTVPSLPSPTSFISDLQPALSITKIGSLAFFIKKLYFPIMNWIAVFGWLGTKIGLLHRQPPSALSFHLFSLFHFLLSSNFSFTTPLSFFASPLIIYLTICLLVCLLADCTISFVSFANTTTIIAI